MHMALIKFGTGIESSGLVWNLLGWEAIESKAQLLNWAACILKLLANQELNLTSDRMQHEVGKSGLICPSFILISGWELGYTCQNPFLVMVN